MVNSDDEIEARLRDDYGRDWTIGRTRTCDGVPHWWKAVRKRQLSDDELNKGFVRTLIYDTAPLLRDALAVQAELEERQATRDSAHL